MKKIVALSTFFMLFLSVQSVKAWDGWTHKLIAHIAEPYLTDKAKVDKALVLTLLEPLGEVDNYTKHYFPKEGQMKVFLKGGSSLVIDTQTGAAVYESLKRRPLLSDMVKLHYNPTKWWTIFSDVFAVCLILITVTGIIMVKGSKGFIGRGGILFIIGIVIPVLFLVL